MDSLQFVIMLVVISQLQINKLFKIPDVDFPSMLLYSYSASSFSATELCSVLNSDFKLSHTAKEIFSMEWNIQLHLYRQFCHICFNLTEAQSFLPGLYSQSALQYTHIFGTWSMIGCFWIKIQEDSFWETRLHTLRNSIMFSSLSICFWDVLGSSQSHLNSVSISLAAQKYLFCCLPSWKL